MRQFVELQNEHKSFVFVANYHALTSERLQFDPELLRKNTYELVVDYLAIGLDPKKTTLYLQTSVPQVMELACIFNNLLTIPYLQRAHAYKAAEEKGINVNVGTFSYPVLMAADILIMDPNIVPVGKDQQQHLEIARDIAMKFNKLYGETFLLPRGKILDEVAIVPGTDGQKMSKSYGNTIPLFSTKDEVTKIVMGIVTDSEGAFPKNVYNIHKFFRPESDLKTLYKEHEGQYRLLKETLIEDIESFVAPMRERRASITEADVVDILKHGGLTANQYAEAKMQDVREKIGVSLGRV